MSPMQNGAPCDGDQSPYGDEHSLFERVRRRGEIMEFARMSSNEEGIDIAETGPQALRIMERAVSDYGAKWIEIASDVGFSVEHFRRWREGLGEKLPNATNAAVQWVNMAIVSQSFDLSSLSRGDSDSDLESDGQVRIYVEAAGQPFWVEVDQASSGMTVFQEFVKTIGSKAVTVTAEIEGQDLRGFGVIGVTNLDGERVVSLTLWYPIFVRAIDGSDMVCEVSGRMDVAAIKGLIELRANVPAMLQKLQHGGKVLTNGSHRLGDIGIDRDNTIILTLRLLGGASEFDTEDSVELSQGVSSSSGSPEDGGAGTSVVNTPGGGGSNSGSPDGVSQEAGSPAESQDGGTGFMVLGSSVGLRWSRENGKVEVGGDPGCAERTME